MIGARKRIGPAIDAAVAKAVNYEITIADLARRSERRAWRVAGASLLMSLCLAAVLAWMQPLKRDVPYLVMADAYTGTAALTRVAGSPDFERIKASDAVNRSNIAHYMLARESYDADRMTNPEWRMLYTMSSHDVISQYRTERDHRNPDSPYAQYGTQTAIRVKLLSITPIGGSPSKPPTGATVRFQRLLFDNKSGATRALDNKIATIEFKYNDALKMNDEDSIANPLRFQVTSYHVDNDATTPPPPEIAMAPVNASGATP